MPVRSDEHERVVRWVDICHALYMTGHMTDFAKAECLRVSKLLQNSDRATRVRRGFYKSQGGRMNSS